MATRGGGGDVEFSLLSPILYINPDKEICEQFSFLRKIVNLKKEAILSFLTLKLNKNDLFR